MGGLLLEGGMMGLSISSSGTSLSLISSENEWYIHTANINANTSTFYDFSSHFIQKTEVFSHNWTEFVLQHNFVRYLISVTPK